MFHYFLSEVYCVYLLRWGLASSRCNFWFGVRPDSGPILAWGLVSSPGPPLSGSWTLIFLLWDFWKHDFQGFLFCLLAAKPHIPPVPGNTLKGNLIVYCRAPVSWWQILWFLCPKFSAPAGTKERWAAAGVRSPLWGSIYSPPSSSAALPAFTQMISAFNWTFLVLLDRRTLVYLGQVTPYQL